jgi:phospholipase C
MRLLLRAGFLCLVFLPAVLTGCGGGSSSAPPPPPPSFQLTLTGPAANRGTVTSAPSGVNCPTTCTASFAQNTQVTLTATPASGFSFGGWGGACSGTATTCSLTITAATSATATFNSNAPPGSLTVSVNGVGSGTVTSTPAGINCPTTCSANFPDSSQVTLTATPAANNVFGGWSGGCSGSSCVVTVLNATPASATASFGLTLQAAINHIVFLAQENRSFDHYFGAMRQYWKDNGYPDQPFAGLPQFPTNAPTGLPPAIPGCSPAYPYAPPPATFQDCVFDRNTLVPSFHLQTACLENPSPSWNESHKDWSFDDPTGATLAPAALDGFVWTTGHGSRSPAGQPAQFMDTNGVRAMGYYDGDDLNYYYFMASNFATSDQWFSPVMSRTNPNREYLIAGSSYGFAYPNGTNDADNFQTPTPIIFQELQDAGISWKVYVYPDPNAHDYGSLHCAANDPSPQCLYQISYLHNFTYGQTIINQFPEKIVPISQFYTDAQAGALPQVAQIEPASSIGLDEHPADNDPGPGEQPCCSVQAGAAYVKTLIDAVMGTPAQPSASWKDTVFILTYDEFGGFYDHIAPHSAVIPDQFARPVDLFQGPPPNGPDICVLQDGPTCQFQFTGYRVPLVVVSPFTKRNYVSHDAADFTAILKLIETRFGVAALTARDAAQIDMSAGATSFFDFVNEPWKTPPANVPAQNQSLQCDLSPPQ